MLDVAVLGPTEARMSGVSVSLSPLERNLLAVLAISTGTVLSTERIIDSLWGDRHPASPRSRVQGLVSSIRRKIGDALVTRHPGYLLDADELSLDLAECHDLVRQARAATSPGETADYLNKALALWRGEPLDGVTAPGIEADRARLNELRVGLLEERFEADLKLGRHAQLAAELTAIVAAHPLRERLVGQLMLALYRCNRQADALRVYQELRERLADELGSDPCADLRNLHAAILRGNEGQPARAEKVDHARVEAAEPRPHQLPASVGHFTGRDDELAVLSRAITPPSDEPRVLLVSGAGGLGKTALVVRWAHSIAERYPDGQIFIDLHSRVRERKVSGGDAVGAALGALGVAKSQIPPTVDERATLHRSLISGRRVLIVADDADSLSQLLPLVPPTSASLMVATSRRRLGALSAYHAVSEFSLEPLTPQAAKELLARMVGSARLRDPATARLVQWCGGWPLAIRIAGTKLAARPWQSLTDFVDELGELSDLSLDDDPRSVHEALVSAHRSLSPAAAHLFGRLGLGPTSPGLQPSADTTIGSLRRLFDELVAANLVTEVGPDRYLIHDVIRRFARQCAVELRDRDAVDEWVRRGTAPGIEAVDRMADPYRI
ncbi:MAG: BTAD domain-containing putative transcriptional regulator [Micromonosporaceae bacterium]